MTLEGGCHCGAVRFAISAPAPGELLDCNCSICVRTGYLHWIVPHGSFVLRSGQDSLIEYRFGTGAAEHLFCKVCGIKSFYQPRSHSDCWSVNFRCLDQGHSLKPKVVSFDGRDWELARGAL